MTRKHNKRPRSERPHHPAVLAAQAERDLTDEERNLRYKARLVAAADEQLTEARRKQTESWYWGETGLYEESAVDSARRLIESVPTDLTHNGYCREMDRAFDERISFYRESDAADPDGYALGTLHAIRRNAGSS